MAKTTSRLNEPQQMEQAEQEQQELVKRLQVFDFGSQKIRALWIEDVPWFVIADIGKAINAQTPDLILWDLPSVPKLKDMPRGWTKARSIPVIVDDTIKMCEMACLSELGVYCWLTLFTRMSDARFNKIAFAARFFLEQIAEGVLATRRFVLTNLRKELSDTQSKAQHEIMGLRNEIGDLEYKIACEQDRVRELKDQTEADQHKIRFANAFIPEVGFQDSIVIGNFLGVEYTGKYLNLLLHPESRKFTLFSPQHPAHPRNPINRTTQSS
jgi:hypothetical protein